MTDITAAVGELKRAAIDAAMKERDYIVEGDIYVYRPMGMQGVPGSVTRPGKSGDDGGVVLSVPSQHERAGAPEHVIEQQKQHLTAALAEEFSNIRHTIDTLVEPWKQLPKPDEITASGEGCDKLMAGLMGAVSGSGSVVSGAGELAARLARVSLESTSFSGGAFDVFKERYIDDSPLRAVRLTALAEVMGQAVSAEAEVWKSVEKDLPKLLQEYTKAFSSLARGKAANPELTFKVIGSVLAGIALFTTAGTAIALAGAGIVVSLAESISAKTESASGAEARAFNDVAGGLHDLQTSLTALSQRIHDEEGALIAGIDDAISRVHSNADKFQLQPAPIYEANNDGVMRCDPQKDLSLARSYMPAAADAVRLVSTQPEDAASKLRSALWRDYSIGWRVAGAAYRFADLSNLLKALLDEFAWDLDRGARNFELAILDWANAEEQNIAASRALAAEIETGVTHGGGAAEDLLDVPRTVDPSVFAFNLQLMMRGNGDDDDS